MIRDSQALLHPGPMCSEIGQSRPVSRLDCSQERLCQAGFESYLIARMPALVPFHPCCQMMRHGTGEEMRVEGE